MKNLMGFFLSNGPGDPAATGKYAIPIIKQLIKSKIPIFGICLGHQILSLALGAKTSKMHLGHRGANHPVKNLKTKKVEITSQNHGFKVEKNSIPNNVNITHLSLFDKSVEGIELKINLFFLSNIIQKLVPVHKTVNIYLVNLLIVF
jgi:carbamoyl-phosphate synthase small subunit